MAQRPVFCCKNDGAYWVTKFVDFKYYPGFSLVQKQKSILSLHSEFTKKFQKNILEVSTKSNEEFGIRLSAFNLVDKQNHSVECQFQSSKKFEHGGPYIDILDMSSRDAKRDQRLRDSGTLVSFVYCGHIYPLVPKTAFYDWVYINTLWHNNLELAKKVLEYEAFSDIEFNPNKSLNCQARSIAIFTSLIRRNEIEYALSNFEVFVSKVYPKM